jgi:hypothetical protein
MEEGGFIPHTDHSCPPDVSFANYAYYLARMAAVCRGHDRRGGPRQEERILPWLNSLIGNVSTR